MYFNPYSILPFATSIAVLSMGLLVFNKCPNVRIGKIFLIWCGSMFIWLFNYSLAYSSNNPDIALMLGKIACSAVILFPVIFHHFITIFLDIKKDKKLVFFAYFLTAAQIPFILFTNHFIAGVSKFFFGFYGKAGPLYIYSIILFALFLLRPMFLLWQAARKNNPDTRKLLQTKYILVAFTIAYLASVDFLPKYNINIYPFGSIFILAWVIIMSYAILKHNLLDINIVLRKGLAYSLLIAALTLLYLIIIVISENFFRDILGYKSIITSVLITTLIAIFFIPLRNKIQSFVDRVFFKKAPVEIAHENELLRQEVAQVEKHKAVAALASGIAHEVRNPLTALKTFYEHFPQKKDDPEFVAKFTHIAGKEIGRIEGLIQQLLDFAKPSPLSFRATDMNRLIQETLDLIANKLESNAIQLHYTQNPKPYTPNPNPCTLNADPNQIKQALLNIFLNAIDAMPGGGSLTVGTRIKILNSSNPVFEISIRDTGSGIAAADLKHIFEPFYSKKASGTGLGLAITQGIIEEHGGKIKVTSNPGKGTEFIIELPAGQQDTR